MRATLDWARDGADWPLREASQFVRSGDMDWHVQILGDGPPLVLVHGTGASVHSWRDIAPRLAKTHRVIAMDLPGHGFTRGRRARDMTLPGMASAVSQLLDTLKLKPVAFIGHSAGAAVSARLSLDGLARPQTIIGLNAAMLPFPGAAGKLFPSLARALFLNPLAPVMFAGQANARSVGRLIAGTGSHLNDRGLALYLRLFETSSHVAGAIAMMAQWDLEALTADLPRLAPELVLIVGESDKAVPPAQAKTVCGLAPKARIVSLPNLGHLAHEEAPDVVAPAILAALPA